MKVHVKYRVHDAAGRFRLKSFSTVAPIKPCCDRLADEFGGIIDISLVGFPRISNVQAVVCTASYRKPNGEIAHTVTPIDRCPWCGERIEVIPDGLDTRPEEPAHRPPVSSIV